MCQKDKLSKGRIARKRSNVITQSVRGGLQVRSVVLFDNGNGEDSTDAPRTSLSPVFHSGLMTEFTTNFGYSASNFL